MKEVIIYSHRVDNDGYASAAIMNMFFPTYVTRTTNDICNIKHVPWTYGDDEPIFEDFLQYDYVLVLDLHFNNELTLKLRNHFKDNFIWIDHHAQCIIDWENFCLNNNESPHVNGFQSKKTNLTHRICNSAAELCWYFLFGCEGNDRFDAVKGLIPGDKLPYIIELISDFDVWNKNSNLSWDTEIYPFQMGSRICISNYFDMEEMIYHSIYKENIDKVINDGLTIIKYETAETLKDIRSGKIIRTFEFDNRTYKALILNTTKRSSNVFVNMPDRDEYDCFICYNIVEKNKKLQYRYSMYAFDDNVTCAGMIINGVKFNGHAHACGAQSDFFIF